MIELKPTLAGYYKMEAVNAKTGKKRLLADWFPNLITDFGLNYLPSTSSWVGDNSSPDNLYFFHVGSGTNAPLNTDTALQSPVATTTTVQSHVVGAAQTPPYYGWRRVTKRFGEGVAAGNLSEVGVGAGLDFSTPTSLFSRALILDALGDPTTITVLADEFLDVTYELRLYAPTADVVESITDPETSTIHTVTVRPSVVTSSMGVPANTTSRFIYWGTPLIGNGGMVLNRSASNSTSNFNTMPATADGAIGAVTENPSGNMIVGGDVFGFTNNAYSNNSLERTATITAGLSVSNANIRSLKFSFSGGGVWQAQFDPVIPKTSTDILTLGVKIAWGRHTP